MPRVAGQRKPLYNTGIGWLDAILNDPTAAMPAPAIGGALFTNPRLASMFRVGMTNPTAVGDVTQAGMMKALEAMRAGRFPQAVIRMGEQAGLSGRTMGSNIANSMMGETFGRGGVIPFPGAPAGNLGDPALLAALLTQILP